MKKLSKRFKKCLEKIDQGKIYNLTEAIAALKGLPHPKFDESVEVACKLNVDPKQADQLVRGTVILPHGIGKEVRICVFCKGEDLKKAKEAGADFAGEQDLIEKIKKGWLDFDKTASSSEMMKNVAQLGKILGPRGMMPSPKLGTVGPDISRIVQELKSGKLQFRTDKTANIHSIIGKISFSVQDICENIIVLIKAILAVRPASSKGRFLNNVSISTTMGPAVKLDVSSLTVTK